eukprot:Hpha_TRINITY_DN12006_c0_g1::TRINITY_DN12006_c0_g1_i1::g.141236::m.141236
MSSLHSITDRWVRSHQRLAAVFDLVRITPVGLRAFLGHLTLVRASAEVRRFPIVHADETGVEWGHVDEPALKRLSGGGGELDGGRVDPAGLDNPRGPGPLGIGRLARVVGGGAEVKRELRPEHAHVVDIVRQSRGRVRPVLPHGTGELHHRHPTAVDAESSRCALGEGRFAIGESEVGHLFRGPQHVAAGHQGLLVVNEDVYDVAPFLTPQVYVEAQRELVVGEVLVLDSRVTDLRVQVCIRVVRAKQPGLIVRQGHTRGELSLYHRGVQLQQGPHKPPVLPGVLARIIVLLRRGAHRLAAVAQEVVAHEEL